MPDAPTCANCRWYRQVYPDPFHHGECHRHAPVVVPVSDGRHFLTAWPATPREDVCGEHIPTEKDPT